MTDAEEPEFSREELLRLTLRLQALCEDCIESKQCNVETRCSVSMARGLIGSYLINRRRVLARAAGPVHFVVPCSATARRELLSARDDVARMCERCMFHVPTCFLNVLYDHVEQILDIEPRKAPNERPGELVSDATGGKVVGGLTP